MTVTEQTNQRQERPRLRPLPSAAWDADVDPAAGAPTAAQQSVPPDTVRLETCVLMDPQSVPPDIARLGTRAKKCAAGKASFSMRDADDEPETDNAGSNRVDTETRAIVDLD